MVSPLLFRSVGATHVANNPLPFRMCVWMCAVEIYASFVCECVAHEIQWATHSTTKMKSSVVTYVNGDCRQWKWAAFMEFMCKLWTWTIYRSFHFIRVLKLFSHLSFESCAKTFRIAHRHRSAGVWACEIARMHSIQSVHVRVASVFHRIRSIYAILFYLKSFSP